MTPINDVESSRANAFYNKKGGGMKILSSPDECPMRYSVIRPRGLDDIGRSLLKVKNQRRPAVPGSSMGLFYTSSSGCGR